MIERLGPFSSERVERALAGHRVRERPPARGIRQAAVAVVLRLDRPAPEVLLMKRVERTGDRWSGQVCFPGGHAEEHDADLVRTAVRETQEEVGLDLDRSARLLTRLAPVRGMARGRVLPMAITPIVFAQTRDDPLVLGPEAEASFWLPLDRAAAGELDGRYDWQHGPLRVSLPCLRYERWVVWGLTYRMLSSVLEIAGAR